MFEVRKLDSFCDLVTVVKFELGKDEYLRATNFVNPHPPPLTSIQNCNPPPKFILLSTRA